MRTITAGLSAIAIMFSVVACTATVDATPTTSVTTQAPTDVAASPPAAVTPDQSIWALPLDAYRQRDINVFSRALSEEYMGCLRSAGIEFGPSTIDVDALRDAPTAVTTVTGRRLFTPEIAQNHGYRYVALDHHTPLGIPDDLPDADSSETATACNEQTGADFPPYPQPDFLFSLTTQAYWEAKEDSAVVTAADRWRICLADWTTTTLPDDPTQMPTQDLHDELGFTDDDDARTVEQPEIDFAVHDAQCREDSGYTSALYQAEYDLSARYLEQNRAELDYELAGYEQVLAYSERLLAAADRS